MYVSMYFSVDKQNSASGFFGTDLRYTDFYVSGETYGSEAVRKDPLGVQIAFASSENSCLRAFKLDLNMLGEEQCTKQ